MKINWGTGITIGIVLFIAFILFFVIKMSTDSHYDYDLVVEEYYQKDLAYQTEIDAEENLKLLTGAIIGKKTAGGWLLNFPQEVVTQEVIGTVFLYRPSNKQLDFQLPLEISGTTLLIPDDRLLGGRWNITIEWEQEGTAFLYRDEIVY
ncbi:MAG: cytochrome C oxidase Cbb3 [Flavobacteriaceae bacterium]|nr:cytochrome C oxidase Cbb3 [Flavobacteriaceae bacterium]